MAIVAPVDPSRVIRPQPGMQTKLLESRADIAIAGGAAGASKTYGLCLEPLRHLYSTPNFEAVIFRRTAPMINAPGGLRDTTVKIYPHVGGVSRRQHWIFPQPWLGPTTRMKVTLGQMQYEDDRLNWKSSQVPLIAYDQLEEFEASQFWYMLSRNRSMTGVPGYIRAGCNPQPGWLADLIDWWIKPDGYPDLTRSGVLRWFVRDERSDALLWADTRQDLIERHGKASLPMSLTFIPGTIHDNPILMEKDPGYLASLQMLPLIDRERLLGGNWKIRPSAGKIFNTKWFKRLRVTPSDVIARVRYWDIASSKQRGRDGTKSAEQQARTCAFLMAKCSNGLYLIEDVVFGFWEAHERDTIMRAVATQDAELSPPPEVRFELQPGAAGKDQAEHFERLLAGFPVWRDNPTGDKFVRADPFAAQVQAGNVAVLERDWTREVLDELTAVAPNTKCRMDICDAGSGAFKYASDPQGRQLRYTA